jgi:hypothetical protein
MMKDALARRLERISRIRPNTFDDLVRMNDELEMADMLAGDRSAT